ARIVKPPGSMKSTAGSIPQFWRRTEMAEMTLTGYRTVSLDGLCNAGVDLLAPHAAPALGEVTLRGFPFAIADDPGRCFVALGDGLGSTVSVPLAGVAHNLLFAWRLLESP